MRRKKKIKNKNNKIILHPQLVMEVELKNIYGLKLYRYYFFIILRLLIYMFLYPRMLIRNLLRLILGLILWRFMLMARLLLMASWKVRLMLMIRCGLLRKVKFKTTRESTSILQFKNGRIRLVGGALQLKVTNK